MKRTGAMVMLAIIAVVAGIVALVDVFRYLDIIGTPLDFFVASWFGADHFAGLQGYLCREKFAER